MREWTFISDLHLSPERPEIIQLFEKFVNEVALHTDVLYILGDFLEYWIGDDDSVAGLEGAFDALTKLAHANIPVYFMHGNRDFLIGNELAEKYHFSIIDDPRIVTIQDQPVLLMHGDTLCTDDTDYQQFRKMVREPDWQQQFLAKSIEERKQIAASVRELSQQVNTEKPVDIMDVNQKAVQSTMIEHDVAHLIHGHTHRPDFHDVDLNGHSGQRIVLGDWYKSGSYLRIKDINKKIELLSFD